MTNLSCLPYYGDLRDRVRADGSHWLQPELMEFFNQRADAGNVPLTQEEQEFFNVLNRGIVLLGLPIRGVSRIKHILQKKRRRNDKAFHQQK